MAPASPNTLVPAPKPRHSDLNTPQYGAQRHFLLLPAELRLLCYTYIFSYPSPSPESPSRQLAFLLVCRQIYAEASLLAFSQTEFTIPLKLLPELPSRLGRTRDEQVKAIRNVTVAIDSLTWRDHRPDSYLGFLPRLNPHGFPRLKLNVLTILISHKGFPGDTVFLNFIAHWKKYYYSIRVAWIDTRSTDKSPSNQLDGLINQWLNALNANKVRLVNEDRADIEHFQPFYYVGRSDKFWRRELKDDGAVIEFNRVSALPY